MKSVPIAAVILMVATPSAHAQFSWSYPKPQGHTLYDVVFLDDDTAIAVGEFGTIMVTHNTGASWTVSSKVESTPTDLSRIERLDNNTAIVVGKNGIVLRTSNQGATWALAPASTSNDLLDVSFADALHGVIAAGNQTLRTSNGGLTWQIAPFVAGSAVSIDMITATDVVCVDPLFRSADGGASWSAVTMPADAAGSSQVDFLDSLHGAVGRSSVAGNPLIPPRCYITSDGGATWISSVINANDTNVETVIDKLIYPASNRIAVVGRRNWSPGRPWSGFISRSNDGGTSFDQVDHAWPLHGLAENPSNVALIAGWGGKLMRQTAVGSTFLIGGPHQDPTTFGVNGVSFANQQVGVVFGSEGEHVIGGTEYTFISYTANGGTTWGWTWVAGQLMDVVGLSSTEFVGVGMDATGTKGIVVRSTNGGATWSLIWSQSVPSRLRAVCAPLPAWLSTHAVAVGNSGTVLHINNGVVTSVATGGTDYKDIAFHGTSTLMAVGATDMRSFDGGQTWEPTDNPGDQTVDISAITFLPNMGNRLLFGIAADGIYQSFEVTGHIKIGDFWARDLSATGLTDVAFDPSSLYGVAVGSTVFVNNRQGWQPIEKPTPYPLTHVSVPKSSLSFMSGPDAITFRHQYQTPLPTLIPSLSAMVKGNDVDLRWDVSTDGNLSGFTIVRSTGTNQAIIAGDLPVTSRTFHDGNLTPGATYQYQLLAIDRDGSQTQSTSAMVTIPIATLELLPNQPNPFNPETTIRFVVPQKTHAVLTVHDVTGRSVATLVDGEVQPGMRTITWSPDGIASGVYFVRLRAGKAEVSRKMLLLK